MTNVVTSVPSWSLLHDSLPKQHLPLYMLHNFWGEKKIQDYAQNETNKVERTILRIWVYACVGGAKKMKESLKIILFHNCNGTDWKVSIWFFLKMNSYLQSQIHKRAKSNFIINAI